MKGGLHITTTLTYTVVEPIGFPFNLSMVPFPGSSGSHTKVIFDCLGAKNSKYSQLMSYRSAVTDKLQKSIKVISVKDPAITDIIAL